MKSLPYMKRIVLPDVHIPFHDEALVKAWMDFVICEQPDGIDIIGDVMDCYTLSDFNKNPRRKVSFAEEVKLTKGLMYDIRAAAGHECDIHYSEGNHEYRLERMLWGNSKELADLKELKMPQLLDLAGPHIQWHNASEPYKIRDLWYTHGNIIRIHAGMTANAMSQKVEGPVLIGHTHRMGYSPTTAWTGLRGGYEAGHLCNYRELDWVKSPPNWQQGWAVVHFLPQGHHQVEFVEMRNISKRRRILMYRGEAIWEGPRPPKRKK